MAAASTSAAPAPSVEQILIVCENEARTSIVAKVAVDLALPFVPFKMLFVEGRTICLGGDACFNESEPDAGKIAMTPCFIAVGDHDNILSIEQVKELAWLAKEAPGLTPLDRALKNPTFCESDFDAGDEKGPRKRAKELLVAARALRPGSQLQDVGGLFEEDYCNATFAPCLLVAPSQDRNGARITAEEATRLVLGVTDDLDDKHCHSFEFQYLDGMLPTMTWLPGCDDDLDVASVNAALLSPAADGAPGYSLFHRNALGLSCFSEKEAKETCKYLRDIDFVQIVKAALQRKRFELPQHSAAYTNHFCNETMYGKMNLLWVTGLVRLDAGMSAAAAIAATTVAVAELEEFDAWPDPEYVSVSDLAGARAVRNMMLYQGGESNPNEETWNTLLKAHVNGSDLVGAHMLMAEMRATGVKILAHLPPCPLAQPGCDSDECLCGLCLEFE
jgi:pentatricopeptide repeat protein